jgi:hypothetical protein
LNSQPSGSKPWLHEQSTTYGNCDDLLRSAARCYVVNNIDGGRRNTSQLIGFAGRHNSTHRLRDRCATIEAGRATEVCWPSGRARSCALAAVSVTTHSCALRRERGIDPSSQKLRTGQSTAILLHNFFQLLAPRCAVMRGGPIHVAEIFLHFLAPLAIVRAVPLANEGRERRTSPLPLRWQTRSGGHPQ